MRISIRSKFLLLASLLLLAIFGSITISLIRNSTRSLRQDLLEESKAFATLATQPIGNTFAIYKDSGTSKIDQQVDSFLELNDSVTNIAVVDIDGNTAFNKDDSLELEVSSENASSFTPIFINNSRGALQTIVYPYFEASGAHRFSVVYEISDDAIEAAVRSEALSLLYFGVVSLAITLTLTFLLINRIIIAPIKTVSSQAELISSGNLEQQISVRGRDEIASLGDSVNRMAGTLKADITKLRDADKLKSEFLIIASHNLRTPLTVITGNTELLESTNLPPEAKKLLASLKARGQELRSLAEDMLTIAQIEGGEDIDKDAPVINLVDFINKKQPAFNTEAMSKSVKLSVVVPQLNIPLRINERYLEQIIGNVVDNAIKFTPSNGKVSLRILPENNRVTIKVQDSGIGIAKNELEKLFTKFHRGTSVMEYNYEGTGLGLYLTKLLLERHGGGVSVESTVGQGSTFTLYLPTVDTNTPVQNT